METIQALATGKLIHQINLVKLTMNGQTLSLKVTSIISTITRVRKARRLETGLGSPFTHAIIARTIVNLYTHMYDPQGVWEKGLVVGRG